MESRLRPKIKQRVQNGRWVCDTDKGTSVDRTKCGGYKKRNLCRVFPNMNKQVILGILWLAKENLHNYWTQVVVVVKKGHNWISLPLVKSQ